MKLFDHPEAFLAPMKHLRTHGVSLEVFMILIYLELMDGPCNIKEIAEISKASFPRTAALIVKLTAAGLVKKRRGRDTRQRDISLSEEGKKLVATAKAQVYGALPKP